MSLGEVADAGPDLLVDSRVDELVQRPVRADDAERAVLGVDQPDRGPDDPVQGGRQLQAAGDADDRVEQAVQLVAGSGDLDQPVG